MIRVAAGDGIRAVALQAHRIRHAEVVSTAFDDEGFQKQADARFLIVALRWVHRQCSAAAQMTGDGQLREAVAEFEETVFDRAAKEMRDVWEHFDKYIQGGGQLQRGRRRIAGVAEQRQLGVLAWTGSDGSLGSLHWAGLSVSLDASVRAAEKLYAALLRVPVPRPDAAS
jgi:hypothetical protein